MIRKTLFSTTPPCRRACLQTHRRAGRRRPICGRIATIRRRFVPLTFHPCSLGEHDPPTRPPRLLSPDATIDPTTAARTATMTIGRTSALSETTAAVTVTTVTGTSALPTLTAAATMTTIAADRPRRAPALVAVSAPTTPAPTTPTLGQTAVRCHLLPASLNRRATLSMPRSRLGGCP
jgi:hypothetical protein